MCSKHFKILATSICSFATFQLANADITAPDLSGKQEPSTVQGIDGTGIHGIDGTGFRSLGIDGTGLQGIDATGIQGIDGTGIHGIDGTGILTAHRRGLHGNDGTVLQGIDGTGIHGIDGTGIRAKSITSVNASGLKTQLGNIATHASTNNDPIQNRGAQSEDLNTMTLTAPMATLQRAAPDKRNIGFDQARNVRPNPVGAANNSRRAIR